MKTVLISTKADDLHAAIVETALGAINWNCLRWTSSDLPMRQVVSIDFERFPAPTISVESDVSSFQIDLNEDEIILWNRRSVDKPVIDDRINLNDKKIAERDVLCFRDSLMYLLDSASFQINDLASARRAENKGLQLSIARKHGLKIPRTVISNSPKDIRDFIGKVRSSGCVAKPFKAGIWDCHGDILVGYSAIIDQHQITDDVFVRSSPMIFQEYIQKSYEVRITMLGRTPLGVRIDSQKDERTIVDWRTVSPRLLDIEPIITPTSVVQKCRAMMKFLGLIFGCFDFIVNRHGEWIFLELNQMGQFLWVEQANPQIPVLDMFLQMITLGETNVSPSFYYGIKFEDVAADSYARLGSERSSHAPLEPIGFVKEVS